MTNINIEKQKSYIDIHNLDSIYFIGIGGIGVSGLAFWCIEKKIKVYGYDREKTEITEKLKSKGAHIFYDHDTSFESKNKNLQHIKALNLFIGNSRSIVVYSSAIKINHPLRLFFDSNKILSIKRAEFLGLISSEYDVVAISGTHGKTTIATMLTHILKVGGVDCTAFLGGVSKNYNSNFILGKSNIMVVEADEFDKSFLHLKPKFILVSSLDKDHSDTYPSYENMVSTYAEFIWNSYKKHTLSHLIFKKKTLKKLLIYFNQDKSFFRNITIKNYSLDLESDVDYSISFEETKNSGFRVNLLEKNKQEDNLKNLWSFNAFQKPRHNIENFLAASSLALQLGINIRDIALSINSFLGVNRRFEYHINTKNRVFIEDYAHHPKEIEALIDSLRLMYPSQKLTIIFQPHLFSRTKDFLNEFAVALSKVDTLILLDIYAARELPIEGFGISKLFDLISIEDKRLVSNEGLVSFIADLQPKILISVGAGSITTFSEKLKDVLQ